MIEEYDFDDPKTRRWLGLKTFPFKKLNTLWEDARHRVSVAPLKAVNDLLFAVATAGLAYTVSEQAPIMKRPDPINHQGIEIQYGIADPDERLSREELRRIVVGVEQVVEELDKYPDHFLADACDLETIVVAGREYGSRIAGLYYSGSDEAEIFVGRYFSWDALRKDVARILVHEADHACNMTNATIDDVAVWEQYVVDPGFEVTFDLSLTLQQDGVPPPEGFAYWYGATTVRAAERIKHVEDMATIKELITYGWTTIDSRGDELLYRKVAMLIDRYTDWSGGVMDEDYFRSWSESGFSYADHEAFVSDESRNEERESLDEHADER